MPLNLRSFVPERFLRVLRPIRVAALSFGISAGGDFQQPEEEVEASRSMSVIVAICDAPTMSRRCLVSLQKYAPLSEIIIVDDGSVQEQTLDMIENFRNRDGWRVLRNEKSQGHSRSCELAASMATRPYLCLLNSDTVATPWSWAGPCDAFETDPRIGVIGPSTSYAATKQEIRRAMHCRHYWTDRQIWAFAEQYISRQRPRSRVDLPVVGGFAFFIRRKLWVEMDGFDPNLRDYGNETELCNRVTKRGFRVVWTQNSYIHHFGHQSYGRSGDQLILEKTQAARNYINAVHGPEPVRK